MPAKLLTQTNNGIPTVGMSDHIPIGVRLLLVCRLLLLLSWGNKGCDEEFQVSSINSLFSYIVGSLNFLYRVWNLVV